MSLTALDTVTIVAEPIDGERCGLQMSRPILPGRWVLFASREESEGSPLAEQIFLLESVASLLVAHDRLIVRRRSPAPASGVKQALRGLRRLFGDPEASADSWRPLAQQIASIVRAQFASEREPVSQAALARMPTSIELRRRVQKVLDESVNPVVAGHGGGVSIHEVIDNVLYVRMSGGCQGCGLAENTLKHGVEAAVRDEVPEILAIIDVTDHSSGKNPWQKRSSSR